MGRPLEGGQSLCEGRQPDEQAVGDLEKRAIRYPDEWAHLRPSGGGERGAGCVRWVR
jgi:hypothetical protein